MLKKAIQKALDKLFNAKKFQRLLLIILGLLFIGLIVNWLWPDSSELVLDFFLSWVSNG